MSLFGLATKGCAFNTFNTFISNRRVESDVNLVEISISARRSGGGGEVSSSARTSVDVVPSFKVMDMVARANELDEKVGRRSVRRAERSEK